MVAISLRGGGDSSCSESDGPNVSHPSFGGVLVGWDLGMISLVFCGDGTTRGLNRGFCLDTTLVDRAPCCGRLLVVSTSLVVFPWPFGCWLVGGVPLPFGRYWWWCWNTICNFSVLLVLSFALTVRVVIRL